MLFILLGVFIFLFIFAVIMKIKGNGDDYLMISIIGISSIGFLITLVVILFLLGSYNLTKTSADGEIAIREEQNALVLSQIEPLVEKYLQYEKSTYKELRLTPQTIVALSAYPELKGNEFIQSQMKIIIDNQRIITSLKIKKTRLNSYNLWLFMGA